MFKIKDSLKDLEIKNQRSQRNFLITLLVIVSIFFAISILNTFVYLNVVVEGSSMEKTLHSGDLLIVNKLRQAERQDIIIINVNGKWIIKRVIGIEGDTVIIEKGFVYLKKAGETETIKLDEKRYVKENGVTYSPVPTPVGKEHARQEVVVGKDEIFYLGDNREYSKDSRSEYGCCNESDVIGVVENWSIQFRGLTKLFLLFSV